MGHTLFWDFFGPHGLKTAEHFASHTREFLKRNSIEPLLLQVDAAEGRGTVACRVPEEHEAAVVQALRPRRAEVADSLTPLSETEV